MKSPLSLTRIQLLSHLQFFIPTQTSAHTSAFTAVRGPAHDVAPVLVASYLLTLNQWSPLDLSSNMEQPMSHFLLWSTRDPTVDSCQLFPTTKNCWWLVVVDSGELVINHHHTLISQLINQLSTGFLTINKPLDCGFNSQWQSMTLALCRHAVTIFRNASRVPWPFQGDHAAVGFPVILCSLKLCTRPEL